MSMVHLEGVLQKLHSGLRGGDAPKICQMFSTKNIPDFTKKLVFFGLNQKMIFFVTANLLDDPKSVITLMGGPTDLLGDPKSVS